MRRRKGETKTHHPSKTLHLFDNERPHALSRLLPLEAKVKLLLAHGLVSLLVPHGEIGVLKSLLARNALGRIEREQLDQEIDGEWIGVGKE